MKNHEQRQTRCKMPVAAMLASFSLLLPTGVLAQDDIQTLRKQLEEQRVLIQEQKSMLQIQQERIDRQAEALDKLSNRLGEMEQSVGSAEGPAEKPSQMAKVDDSKSAESKLAPRPKERDAVGDLNNAAVKAGDFPGSFKIPGPRNVSLAIGGFIKAVAIADSDAEAMGADFIPSTLGTRRSDTDGAFSMDTTITRLFLDGRAPSENGLVRGYVECDFNDSNDGSMKFKLRHAYGSWKNSYGTLLAGHTWSTLMDLKVLPEGLTEPTVSGAIFMRQSQLRWSQPLDPSFTLHAAIEDPSSNDVFDSSSTPELGNTKLPDGILGLEYVYQDVGHLRLNGIVRDIEVNLPSGNDDEDLGWGLALTGHLNVLEKDRFTFSTIYGEGLGRYLLGIQAASGSAIDLINDELDLNKNWGGFVAYKHHWTDTLRSSVMTGYARSEPLDWQGGNAFDHTTYAAVNLMWSVLPYLTVGFEYGYGRLEYNDDSYLDNHRIAIGMQFY